jgi:class I fructose-bisphosphate aldolase/fructose-bisphosphate aldolase/2-amino-3,7-dideoxy-D-threo-hept-6-ulosonate synthase
MITSGKQLRLNRFRYRRSRYGLIVPIDHGLTLGPVEGLKSVSQIAGWITHPAITGVIAHKGMVERLSDRGLLSGLGVMIHLNGMSALAQAPDRKTRLTAIETAVRLGADAVSLQINFDGHNDAENLSQLGQVVDEAQEYGLPVLTMLYDKVAQSESRQRLSRLRHLLRIAMELGTDALKIAPPANLAEIPELLDGIAEDVPVFFAGGSVVRDEELFALAEQAVVSGAAGLCVGRNVFQREAPGAVLSQLHSLFACADKGLPLSHALSQATSPIICKSGMYRNLPSTPKRAEVVARNLL